MRQLLFRLNIDRNDIKTLIKVRGIEDKDYSIEDILLILGALKVLEVQMIARLESKKEN